MQKESFTKKLIDHAMEMILLFDLSGRITYSNPKADRLLEYENGLEGVSINEIFMNLFDSQSQRIADGILSGGESHSLMAYRQNRTCFAVEAQIMPYSDEEYMCMALDASKQNYYERKASQSDQQAEEAMQVKTQFVANVTHELRTPVNGILGNVRELLTIETEEEKKKRLLLVERGCNDMHAIINNILDFSKLDAGKFDLEQRRFVFRNMMDYVRSTHSSKISEKGLQFFMTISPEIPETIIGDELRIQQILNNLLSNATKFTHTGKIMVEVVKTAQIDNKIELFFMVIDSGIGIAKEDQDKLFKSFSQVEASTTRKYGGTGLGLCISKQIVELMNGSIHVESEKNKGTMISFHIWVEVPQDEVREMPANGYQTYTPKMMTMDDLEDKSSMYRYGTKENLDEMSRNLSKLILCIEMSNWEKAEGFMDAIKDLTAEAPREIKSAVLRLKMAVQKSDYDKSIAAFDSLQNTLKEAQE